MVHMSLIWHGYLLREFMFELAWYQSNLILKVLDFALSCIRGISIYIYIYHISTHHIYHSYIQAVHSLAINTHCSHRGTRTVCTQLLRGGFPSSFTLTHRHCAQNIWSYCKKIRAKVCVATRDPLVSRLENNLN